MMARSFVMVMTMTMMIRDYDCDYSVAVLVVARSIVGDAVSISIVTL